MEQRTERKTAEPAGSGAAHPPRGRAVTGGAPRLVAAVLLVAVAVLSSSLAGSPARAEEGRRTVSDGRGRSVSVPAEIRRVVTVSDGLVEGVMTALGVQRSLVGIGSRALQKTWHYDFETRSGERYSYSDGMNPVLCLNPWLADLPLVADGPSLDWEKVAALAPDLVILRVGSCNLPGGDDRISMTLRTLDSLRFPVIVLRGPNAGGDPNPASISREIEILGDVFGRPAEARRLAAFLEAEVEGVRARTRGIPEADRPRVLLFGASPSARSQGGVGQVFGLDTIESYFIERIVGARNAYRGRGAFRTVGTEHILDMNPDVMVLCTAAGYHPPREIYEAPAFRHLGRLPAVRNRRVTALPWTPWNCEKRLEYPIDVMVIAQAAFPERFSDIDLGEWLLGFYRSVYGVDRPTATRLRSCQWMDWAAQTTFAPTLPSPPVGHAAPPLPPS